MSYDSTLLALAPTGYWKLADASGSSTAVDSSGNGYTGTVYGGVTFGETGPIASESDTAALFDGSTGYVVLASNTDLALPLPISLVAWVKTTSTSTGYLGIVVKQTAYGLFMFSSEAAFYDWVSSATTTAGPDINDGAWHFLVVVLPATSDATIYVDNVAYATTAAYSISAQGTALTIGSGGPAYGQYWPGTIAQVAVFDTALTATNVTDLWNASQGTPMTGSLLSATSAEGNLLEAVSGSLGAQSDTQALLDLSLSGRT